MSFLLFPSMWTSNRRLKLSMSNTQLLIFFPQTGFPSNFSTLVNKNSTLQILQAQNLEVIPHSIPDPSINTIVSIWEMFSESDYFSPAPPLALQFSSFTEISVLPASTFTHTVCCPRRSRPKSEPITSLPKNQPFMALQLSKGNATSSPSPPGPFLCHLINPPSLPSLLFSITRLSTVSQTPEASHLRAFARVLSAWKALLSDVHIDHSLTSFSLCSNIS